LQAGAHRLSGGGAVIDECQRATDLIDDVYDDDDDVAVLVDNSLSKPFIRCVHRVFQRTSRVSAIERSSESGPPMEFVLEPI
jgi:hypothetical protein